MNCQALLLLDGHDEYKAGSNESVDHAITKDTLSNCCIILTSRTSKQLLKVRSCMDWEVEISGFNYPKIEEYAKKYLKDSGKVQELMSRLFDIYTLMQVPILLQMTCVIFQGQDSLPETKAGIIGGIVQRSIDRSALRASGKKSDMDVKVMLEKLGKAAWESLRSDIQQLIMSRVRFRRL